MKTKVPLLTLTTLLLLVVTLLAGSAVPQAQAAPTAVAYDMVGSTSLNLVSYTNPWTGAFSDNGDGFQKYERGVSSSIPFAVLDDSLVDFPTDNLGIIDENNQDEFFGVTDTVNGDTSDLITATWVFNISGAENLSLSIDMGAMGDFESADVFEWKYQIDGGPVQTAFINSVDEAASQIYTLAGGNSFTLADPMLVDGVILSNILQTLTTGLTGTGSQLTLTLTAKTDGGSEAFAFQNIVIMDGYVPPVEQPELVINEIDYDQPSTDTAEFVEIKNVGAEAADLSGVTLVLVNGNGGAVYGTFNLPAVSLPAGDYFVVCANETTVANCDLDVSPDTNLIQNGDPDAVALKWNDILIDTVSYEGDTVAPYTEGSGSGLADSNSISDKSISRCGDGVDTNQNNVDFTFTTKSPGVENICNGGNVPVDPVGVCGDPATLIHAIQGSGMASSDVGSIREIEAVVVGDFQDGVLGVNGDLNGFNLQEEDGQADSDPLTSEGIFVYDGSFGVDVNVGDVVRVRGSVAEYNGLTEISNVASVTVCQSPSTATAASLSLPVTSVDDFEAYEGMLVTFQQALVISEYFNFDRFNETVLTSERHTQPTAEFEPGDAANAAEEAYLLDRITLDDGRTSQNPNPAIHPNGDIFDLSNLFRGGGTVEGITGVIDYSFGLYRIQPTAKAIYSDAGNSRTAVPDDVGGSLKVASLNVLNYFTTLDNSGPICGPLADQDCRGADDANEFTRQRAKIIAALKAIDADVVGLIEIENHPQDVPTADLVAGLNTAMGGDIYDYIATGAVGDDAIRVALIYKPASVTPVGDPIIIDAPAFTNPMGYVDDQGKFAQQSRPAVAQTFMSNENGALFTPIVNHLKSKGSSCGAGDDDPQQGSCNVTRTMAAQYLVDTALPQIQASSGDPDVLIIGDLNSYDKEDPIDVLLAGGYSDLIFDELGEYAYSYVFDGRTGYLDYAMANSTMAGQVSGTTIWHINADEADLIDYDTSFKQPAQQVIYAPDAYRASDHDPVIVGLNLNGPPVCSAAKPNPEELWPVNHKFVPVSVIGVTDPEGDAVTINIDAIRQDEPVNGNGDGNTSPDGKGVGTDTAWLRAERDAKANGRAYHVYFTAADTTGSCSGEVVVFAPLNKGKYGDRTDEGPLYDSTLE